MENSYHQFKSEKLDDLLKQYLLEEDGPLKEKVMEMSADAAFSSVDDVVPPVEKEARLFNEFKGGFMYWRVFRNVLLIAGIPLVVVLAAAWFFMDNAAKRDEAVSIDVANTENLPVLPNVEKSKIQKLQSAAEKQDKANSGHLLVQQSLTGTSDEAEKPPVGNKKTNAAGLEATKNNSIGKQEEESKELSSSEKKNTNTADPLARSATSTSAQLVKHVTEYNEPKTEKKPPPDLPGTGRAKNFQDLSQYAGLYWCEEQGKMLKLVYKNSALKVKSDNMPAQRIERVDHKGFTVFTNGGISTFINFRFDENNSVIGLRVNQNSVITEYSRIE
ncbi:MAG: hypothetical protein COA57_03380 [Flavobacteriales bacterium]|nr:MAG: hypothetical protein COA57_03380 [Flavobacteriales bacterium]